MTLRRGLSIALGLLAAAVLVLLAMAAIGGWLAIDDAPLVPPGGTAAPADIERALRLARSHDPRRQRGGLVRALVAEERDVALLLQHAAARWAGATTRIELRPGQALLQASLPSRRARPGTAAPGWFNLHVELKQQRGLPQLQALRIGRLPLPGWAAEPLARWWLERSGFGVDLELPRDVVRHVEFRDRRVVIFYAWRQDTLSRMLATLVPPGDQARLRAYSDRLTTLLTGRDAGSSLSLAELLPPLFALAGQRSAAAPQDAALENRAALLALTFFANQRGLAVIVPAARSWPRPPPLTVTLAGRSDLPLHWLISAAIAAESGTPLADAVGLYKEVSDSRGGSGFSFADLTADRAGTRFGERAVRDALALQQRLAGGVAETDLLPDVTDLPEHLRAEQFAQRFGEVGAAPYLALMREIENRLDGLPLLR